MTLTAPLRKLARAQYSLVRAPVRAFEQVIARVLPADAPARITLDRKVDALDAAVKRLLGTTEAAPANGAATVPDLRADGEHRSDKTHDERGQDEQSGGHAHEPSKPADSVPVEERNRVAEELLDQLEETPLVGELAEAPEDVKQEMADLRAKHLAEEFEAEQARHARRPQDS